MRQIVQAPEVGGQAPDSEGQSGALAELYDRYGHMVFSLAFRITGNSAIAEEITQDVFVQVWRFAAHYDPLQGKLATWLSSFTRNRSIDILRQQKIRPEGHTSGPRGQDLDQEGRASSLEDDLFSLADPRDEAAVEPTVELHQQQQRVRQALVQLPLEQRQALGMAYFMGMSQQEIAAALGQPLGTIKTRIRLGMIKLKEMLG
jgi:RNA polymerase sigma-70 factor (ECF subfamily)